MFKSQLSFAIEAILNYGRIGFDMNQEKSMVGVIYGGNNILNWSLDQSVTQMMFHFSKCQIKKGTSTEELADITKNYISSYETKENYIYYLTNNERYF